MTNRPSIEAHYAKGGGEIAVRILAALGPGAAITPETLAPIDQFHSRGLAATKELVAMLDPQPDERLIDLGSGLGGPARWIAAHFDCHVTGIDLMPEYCEAARALTEAAGLSDRIDIHQGSALETPFADASFDRAYSQNVVMNIADKTGFFREAYRLLKPCGVLAMSNLGAGPNGPHYYPSMWAATADDSFLSTLDETRADLEAAGFDILVLEDTTGGSSAEVDATIKKLEAQELPPIGVQTFVGARYKELLLNSMRSRRDGRSIVIETLARKPS